MILKIGIFIIIALLFMLVVTFFALRVPILKIDSKLSAEEKLRFLDMWLQRIHKSGKFNGVVLLYKNGKVIFSEAYGVDSEENSKPLTERSEFNLASVSKHFTAMGIVLLHNQSKLNYNDSISKHIPELEFYKDVTIENLLHHTSGIPDYMKLVGRVRNKCDIFTTSEMVSLYQLNHPKLKFTPGSKFQYSNAGYVLLSEIIERVSGTSFEKFMSSKIFKPLNMENTQVFNLLSGNEPENRVYGYRNSFWLFGGKKLSQDLNFFDGVAGDGAIYSSARDLAIWHRALIDGDLVSNDIYNTAYTPSQLSDGSKTKYGFGWFLNSDNSVEHAGGWQGFTSFIHRSLEHDELIVVLDNSSNTLRVNSIGFRFNSIGLNLKYFMSRL